MIVATPGRLEDMLKRQQDNLNLAAGVKALVGGNTTFIYILLYINTFFNLLCNCSSLFLTVYIMYE